MKIAIITPCFNLEKYIGDCLKSVALSVNFGSYEYEHIVIDDGSTDKSWEIINNFKNPFLKPFRFETNKGQSKARNYAIANTDAQYVLCLDGDDVIFQNSLRILSGFVQNQPLDWVYFDFIRSDEKRAYLIGEDYYGYDFKKTRDVLWSMYQGSHFFQHKCIFKRDLFLKVGGYDEKISRAVDFDLFTRFLLDEIVPVYLPSCLYIHRLHEKNMSALHKDDPVTHKKDIAFFYEKYKDRLKKIIN